VICFQNLYLWLSDTTVSCSGVKSSCCDLLSKFISLAFWYNLLEKSLIWMVVVICFQNLYLWLSDTTGRLLSLKRIGCDLLSKFISLAFWYNTQEFEVLHLSVVICFQNLYLWLSDTTLNLTNEVTKSCDLLSKFISLAFWYNFLCFRLSLFQLWFAFKIYIFGFLIQLEKIQKSICKVVICFQNLYLWLSDTTIKQINLSQMCCDLLSKFISLAFWYNRRNKI